MTEDQESKVLVIGLSGPSSSGKTTLARLLRSIFNIDASPETSDITIKLFILHEDDFYKTDQEIPTREATSTQHGTRTLQDWDCVESLDLPLLDRTIRHVKQHGRPPPDLFSHEDQNSVGDVGVSTDEVDSLKTDVTGWLKGIPASHGGGSSGKQVTICIFDGFLMFPPPPTLLDSEDGAGIQASSVRLLKSLHATLEATLDLKVFLPSTRERTVERRARRAGYVTLEGFWKDPPGYVEEVVWPNYVRDQRWLFRTREDVDGGLVDREGQWIVREGIVVGPGRGDVPMRQMLPWGIDVVKGGIKGVLGP